MHELSKNWKIRSFIISLIILITCVLFYLLDSSDWANAMRLDVMENNDNIERDKDRGDGSFVASILGFLASFLKEFVLIGVPMAIAIGIGASYKFIKTKFH